MTFSFGVRVGVGGYSVFFSLFSSEKIVSVNSVFLLFGFFYCYKGLSFCRTDTYGFAGYSQMAWDNPASVSLYLEVVLVLDLSFFSPILQGNLQIHHVGQDGQVSAHLLSLNTYLLCGSPDLALPWGGVGARRWCSVSLREKLALPLLAQTSQRVWTPGRWVSGQHLFLCGILHSFLLCR